MTPPGARTRAPAVCIPGMWAVVVKRCRAGRVGGVVAYHDVAEEHGSPLAYEGVVSAHRASRLTTWCARTCWATWRA